MWSILTLSVIIVLKTFMDLSMNS